MYEAGTLNPYGTNFSGSAGAGEVPNRVDTEFVYGSEDTVFIDNLNLMRPDQDDAVIDLANDLGYLSPKDRPEAQKADLAKKFITFLGDNQEPTVSAEIFDLFSQLANAPDETYLEILDNANDSGICRDHTWAQRLITVLVSSHQSEQRRQYNATVLTKPKNFFGSLRVYTGQNLGSYINKTD